MRVLVSLSSSPFLAVLGLVALTLGLSLKAGLLFINWFFFTLIIVYVGGIMVMFTYLSRIVRLSKVNTLNPGLRALLVRGGLACVLLLLRLQRRTDQVSWLERGFFVRSRPLALFRVLYLLVGLLRVYRLCQKAEGPLQGGAKRGP